MLELQETVAVLLLLTLVLLMDPQLRPDGTESVKVMPPLKPRINEIVSVVLVDEPTLALAEVADMVKSGGVPKVNEVVVE